MSTREYAKTLIDQIPESKLIFIVPYLQGAALPDDVEMPNAKTLAAIEEVENMKREKGNILRVLPMISSLNLLRRVKPC